VIGTSTPIPISLSATGGTIMALVADTSPPDGDGYAACSGYTPGARFASAGSPASTRAGVTLCDPAGTESIAAVATACVAMPDVSPPSHAVSAPRSGRGVRPSDSVAESGGVAASVSFCSVSETVSGSPG
jgi:hypothetical protein